MQNKDTYDEIKNLVWQMKEAAEYDVRLSVIEESLKRYVEGPDIHEIISEKIKKYDETQGKINAKKIQWGAIVQQVIVTSVICLIGYYITKGAAG